MEYLGDGKPTPGAPDDPNKPIFGIVDIAGLDLCQRLRYRKDIENQQLMDGCEGDPGVRANAGLSNDLRDVFIWECYHLACNNEDRICDELDVDESASGAATIPGISKTPAIKDAKREDAPAGPVPEVEASKSEAAGTKEAGGQDAAGDGGIVRESHPNIFRKNGDVWEVAYAGTGPIMVNDTKGMSYIALLLKEEPNKKLPCLVLEGQCTGLSSKDINVMHTVSANEIQYGDGYESKGGKGVDRDEMIDGKTYVAVMEQKRKLQEALQNETDPAKIAADKEDLAGIEQYLGSNLALDGSIRSFIDQNEKARTRVKRAIGTAIESIAEHHKPAATHFQNCIKTGASCSYTPETSLKWVL